MRRVKFIQQYKLKEGFIHEVTTRKRIRKCVKKNIQNINRSKIVYLDVGCGTGRRTVIFINFLKELGFKVDTYGIDLNPNNVKQAGKMGIKAIISDMEKEEPPLQADIITCFEVIEHIYDTDSFVKNIRGTLNHSGILLISTPNTVFWKNRIAMLLGVPPLNLEVSLKSYYGLKFFKKYYKNYTPAGHIRGFTPLSLKEVLEDNGFRVIAIKGLENWRITRFLDFFSSLATNFLIIAEKGGKITC